MDSVLDATTHAIMINNNTMQTIFKAGMSDACSVN